MSPCLGSTSPARSLACLHPPGPPPSSLAVRTDVSLEGRGGLCAQRAGPALGSRELGQAGGSTPQGWVWATGTPDPGTPEAPRSLGLSERGRTVRTQAASRVKPLLGRHSLQRESHLCPILLLRGTRALADMRHRGPGRVQATQGWLCPRTPSTGLWGGEERGPWAAGASGSSAWGDPVPGWVGALLPTSRSCVWVILEEDACLWGGGRGGGPRVGGCAASLGGAAGTQAWAGWPLSFWASHGGVGQWGAAAEAGLIVLDRPLSTHLWFTPGASFQ